MNILLVEDNEDFLKQFAKQLELLGNVYSFKSANGAILFLHTTEVTLDLVVCDHNILRFENEPHGPKAYGDQIYNELRMVKDPILNIIPFVHFSADPCPESYINSSKDGNFYKLLKTPSVDLVEFINSIKINIGI